MVHRMDGTQSARAEHAASFPTASTAPAATPFLLLAAVAGIGQVAANLPLPSLPAIADAFGVGNGGGELVLAVFLAAFAPFQLVWGPLSDRHGRRPVVLGTLALFAAGSLVCAAAPNFAVLLAGRVIQAAGGAAGLVIARAMIRDANEGAGVGRGMASLSMAIAAVPAFSPLAGAGLDLLAGWRAGFLASAAAALLVLAWAARALGESNTTRLAVLDAAAIARGYRGVWASARFRANVLVAAGAMGGLFAFGAGSPNLYINEFGLTPTAYALYPLIAVVGVVIGGGIARRLMKRGQSSAGLLTGTLLMLAGGLGMVALEPLGLFDKHGVNVTMSLFVLGLGLALPAAFALALAEFKGNAGTAASLAGAIQIAGGAVAAGLAGVIGMPAAMAACGLLAVTSLVITPKKTGGSAP
ncbi:MFS transporter [Elioraea sp.]|uniref:MFS transporter n=1 Tax=Elioraea sp. TaxID=2185103 RepID=UPI0025BDEDF0|nr:MFS transporter [Elioraea sp.]